MKFPSVDTYRHWHPASESFMTGDQLASALHDGWAICRIEPLAHSLPSGRQVTVYLLELKRNREVARMRVISNPVIKRFLAHVPRLLPRRADRIADVVG